MRFRFLFGRKNPFRRQTKKKWIKVPSKRRAFAEGRGKAWVGRPEPQDVVPNDPNLLEKLGIKKGSKILVFAGSNCDWANAPARENHVVYTDVSKSMTDIARRELSSRAIKSFRTRDAALQPRRRNIYDWSFSFEPIPLESKGLALALVRSLLNRKGAIIADSRMSSDYGIEAITKIYGAKWERKIENIETSFENLSEQNYERQEAAGGNLAVLILYTNESARAKAEIDLRVLTAVDKTKTSDLNYLSERLGIKKEEILKSLERLAKVAKLMNNPFAGITERKNIRISA